MLVAYCRNWSLSPELDAMVIFESVGKRFTSGKVVNKDEKHIWIEWT